MNINPDERNTIVPTLIIGLGGTGAEVIGRIRRLIVESYGNLANLPVVGFLQIDTDRDYKVENPVMSGPELQSHEKLLALVSVEQAERICKEPENFPWIHEWLPSELRKNPSLLSNKEGAGQIRACGRFSFFCNYDSIRENCIRARKRLQHHENYMLEKLNLKVIPKLNIFVVASISGGTGSGMFLDLGYSLQKWFAGETELETTIVIPSPDAFAGIDAALKIRENGYAALMELNYYSDERTEFNYRYKLSEESRVKTQRRPYEYIYIVGTDNGSGIQLKRDDVREAIAQNIFLDLVSNYAPYKRSVRDNIKRSAVQKDQRPTGGDSYPRSFMSFGLASIEIPIHNIRHALAYKLLADVMEWWRNEDVIMPADMSQELSLQLTELRLSENELKRALLATSDSSVNSIIQQRLNRINQTVNQEKWLQCNATLWRPETEKVLTFLNDFLQPRIDEDLKPSLRAEHPDRRLHGELIQSMYVNLGKVIDLAKQQLLIRFNDYLADRNHGSQYLKSLLELMLSVFQERIDRLNREIDRTWKVAERTHWQNYDQAVNEIRDIAPKKILNKQRVVDDLWKKAYESLEKALQTGVEIHARKLSIEVMESISLQVRNLSEMLERWLQSTKKLEIFFQKQSELHVKQAQGLQFIGIKLYENNWVSEWYTELLNEQSPRNFFFEEVGSSLITLVSGLLQRDNHQELPCQLINIIHIPDTQDEEFRLRFLEEGLKPIHSSLSQGVLASKMDACRQFLRKYNKEAEQRQALELLRDRSAPLVRLNETVQLEIGQKSIGFSKVGLLGGETPKNEEGRMISSLIKKVFTESDSIAPLTERERHKILAVQEVGGFSLRCIRGIEQLQSAYHSWYGQRIMAERDRLNGVNRENPPPVHLQDDIVYWDVIPPDPTVEKLVLACRALGILFEETIQVTLKTVIRYQTSRMGMLEKITIASSWDGVTQVLQVPQCREDREHLESKLKDRIHHTNADFHRQGLTQLFLNYLENRLETFRPDGGEDYPQYKREKNIILGLIEEYQLPLPNFQSELFVSEKIFECSNQQDSSVVTQYKEHLKTIAPLISTEALEVEARKKASNLGLSESLAKKILQDILVKNGEEA